MVTLVSMSTASQTTSAQTSLQSDDNGIEQMPNMPLQQPSGPSLWDKLHQLRNSFPDSVGTEQLPQESIPFPAEGQFFDSQPQAVHNSTAVPEQPLADTLLQLNPIPESEPNTPLSSEQSVQSQVSTPAIPAQPDISVTPYQSMRTAPAAAIQRPVIPAQVSQQPSAVDTQDFVFTQPDIALQPTTLDQTSFAHLIPEAGNISFTPGTENMQKFQLESQAIGSLQVEISGKVQEKRQRESQFALATQPNFDGSDEQTFLDEKPQIAGQRVAPSVRIVAKKLPSAQVGNKKHKPASDTTSTIQTAASALSSGQGGGVIGAADFEQMVIALIGVAHTTQES